jgi:uncharacterized iron-regulated membrane protein
MKIFFRRIHLYLSLAAGLVILVCCFTGAVLVFEKDLQMAMNSKRYYVEAAQGKLSIDQLVQGVKAAYPTARVNGIRVYEAPTRSTEVSVNFPGKNEAAAPTVQLKDKKPKIEQRQPGFTIFVNPYTGEVLEKYSYRETWFYTMFSLHRWLLGGEGSIGKYIVGVSTFIFLFILLTGIILWWPKTKKILKQRLKIKTNAGWKRINHDLHLVFGFYSAIFLFIFAFTALAWSFEWFNNGIYAVTNSPLKPAPAPKSVFIQDAKKISFDKALTAARTVYTNAEFFNIAMPRDSAEAINVTVLPTNAMHETATDAVYLDQYSGAVLKTIRFSERSLGAQVRSTFKPIHTGSIWGTPSKIIAFIVCLFGITFPITGTIIWINRTRKKKNSTGVKVRSQEAFAD